MPTTYLPQAFTLSTIGGLPQCLLTGSLLTIRRKTWKAVDGPKRSVYTSATITRRRLRLQDHRRSRSSRAASC